MLAAGRARAIGVSNFMRGPPREPAQPGRRRPGRQPDRGAPVLQPAAAAQPDGAARHRDPGLVADRRRLRLRPDRTRPSSRTRSSSSWRRSTARRLHRSSCAGTSSTASARSRSRSSRTASPRTSTSSTSQLDRRRGRRDRRPRHRRPRRPRPGEHRPGHLPVQGRERLMTTWTSDELDAIGDAEELTLASVRRDGTMRRPVTMWVVRAGDDVYVRSVNGRGVLLVPRRPGPPRGAHPCRRRREGRRADRDRRCERRRRCRLPGEVRPPLPVDRAVDRRAGGAARRR